MDAALTGFDDSLRPRLAWGVVFSLLAHAGLAMVILAKPSGLPGPTPQGLSAPPAETEKPPIRPGIEESTAVSINWLGFADPTEHQATPADIEQAALSPAAAGVPEVTAPVELTAESETPIDTPETEPTVEVASVDPETNPAEETATEPAEEAVETVEAASVVPEPSKDPAAQPPLIALRADAPTLRSSPLLQVVRRATARARALAARAAAQAAATTPPPGEAREALPSEKESDATSIDKIAEWNLGKPPAVEGLEITPVRPRWTVTTRLASAPRNPVVRLEFRRDGAVVKASYLPGQDTGYRDVDGPLLDALYRWTARGKALDELDPGDPDAVVAFSMRIVLIPDRGTIRRSPSNR